MKLCIATSDKTSWILPAFAYLMDKHCPEWFMFPFPCVCPCPVACPTPNSDLLFR